MIERILMLNFNMYTKTNIHTVESCFFQKAFAGIEEEVMKKGMENAEM